MAAQDSSLVRCEGTANFDHAHIWTIQVLDTIFFVSPRFVSHSLPISFTSAWTLGSLIQIILTLNSRFFMSISCHIMACRLLQQCTMYVAFITRTVNHVQRKDTRNPRHSQCYLPKPSVLQSCSFTRRWEGIFAWNLQCCITIILIVFFNFVRVFL